MPTLSGFSVSGPINPIKGAINVRSSVKPTVARLAARSLISSLAIRSPDEIDVAAIAWTRKALVRESSLSGMDARLVRVNGRSVITVRDTIAEPGKKRFAIAHELGHLELHHSTQFDLCTGKDLVYFYKHVRPEETEASLFAVELLMPEHFFQPRLLKRPPSMRLVEELAAAFHTTLTATTLRYVELCGERCAIAFSENRAVKWSSVSEDFGFRIESGHRLTSDTYAGDLFAGKSEVPGMKSAPASAWVSGNRLKRGACIYEDSLALPRYEAVLSLLWIKDDIEYQEDDDE